MVFWGITFTHVMLKALKVDEPKGKWREKQKGVNTKPWRITTGGRVCKVGLRRTQRIISLRKRGENLAVNRIQGFTALIVMPQLRAFQEGG